MDPTTSSDESLMVSYAHGDMASFELLYRRHKDSLYRYVVRQIRDSQLAQDIYQEIWGAIINAAPNYKVNAKWTTWAYRIAHNRVADHFRRFKVVESYEETELEPDQEAMHLIPDAQMPDLAYMQARSADQLRHCLQKLPSVQLEVFLLDQETDLTGRMIAEVVGASYEAVKSRLRYARTSLQDCLSLFGLYPFEQD